MNLRWLSIATVALALGSGCQCSPLFDGYANVIDDASDRHLYFDRLYNPKFDLTRMGKADWYSRFNSFWCPRCTTNGSYDRFDDCSLYPPLHPYQFPGNVMPPPTVRTERIPAELDPDAIPMAGPSLSDPSPDSSAPTTNAPDPDDQ